MFYISNLFKSPKNKIIKTIALYIYIYIQNNVKYFFLFEKIGDEQINNNMNIYKK